MPTLYTWDTPNGHKPVILLEELGLTYDLEMVDIRKGDQRQPEFLKFSPNGKIPALVDDGLTVFELGAILIHLAQKHGLFLPAGGQARLDALAWTFWQAGGLGPMMGQWGYFSRASDKNPQAIERYLGECVRLLDVLEQRLAINRFLAGEAYSIADMMSFPWIKGGYRFLLDAPADRLPPLNATRAWIETIDTRPAVQRAYALLKAGL